MKPIRAAHSNIIVTHTVNKATALKRIRETASSVIELSSDEDSDKQVIKKLRTQ